MWAGQAPAALPGTPPSWWAAQIPHLHCSGPWAAQCTRGLGSAGWQEGLGQKTKLKL